MAGKAAPKFVATKPSAPAGGKNTGAFMKNPSNGKGMKQTKGTTKAPGDGAKFGGKA